MSAQAFEKILFQQFENNFRYTQDSPVYPDVWLAYFRGIGNSETGVTPLSSIRIDLILTPQRNFSAAELLLALRDNLTKTFATLGSDKAVPPWRLASTGETVAASLTLSELLYAVLPLSNWWQHYLWDNRTADKNNLKWLKETVGFLSWYERHQDSEELEGFLKSGLTIREELSAEFDQEFPGLPKAGKNQSSPLWSVSKNRLATVSLYKSVPATKADASRRLFDIDGSQIAWAVLDTGIDARHIAFQKKDLTPGGTQDFSSTSRVVATYDFTRFRDLMSNLDGLAMDSANTALRSAIEKDFLGSLTSTGDNKPLTKKEINDYLQHLESALRSGRMLDWSVLAPLLRIPHNTKDYVPPVHPHGTHVAGIIGANWTDGREAEQKLIGMCPGIELYDIRVLDQQGAGQEFNILAAIQFVRWLNRKNDELIVHGINMSMSMFHEVASFACGRTPVCDACQRLVAEGTVVVAAAGNLGQAIFQLPQGGSDQGFRTVNITDPGNAEAVITVGATHRNKPHTYGISYFSSRGPTGDGRCKPDLVAPGEKVVSTVPGDSEERMDGSSMAAPHVSGAAALLLAKHRELIGQPQRIKEILCRSATDLGRERYFQGHGMLDVLRAIQSV